MSAIPEKDALLWALVCAAYHLERVTSKIPTELENIRKIIGGYPAQTVSSYFLAAAITFDPPLSLVAAQSLYEHYGVDTSGLHKFYPAQKTQ